MSEVEQPDKIERREENVADAPLHSEDALRHFNALDDKEATDELLKCCGSKTWARMVSGRRPFQDANGLLAIAHRIWWSLSEEDWLEAFRSHPKIGERQSELKVSLDAQSWSEEEQSGTRDTSQEALSMLAQANHRYEEKFGFIFIVCATGKNTNEMLALLNERFGNERDTELRVAAEEQRRITHLRLRKLLNLPA